MAKHPVKDLCMFCGENPCICENERRARPGKKPAKKAVAKKAPAFKASKPVPVEKPKPKFKVSAKSTDPDLRTMLSIVRPIASAESRKEIDEVLRPKLSGELDRRVTDWKKRNGKT